VAGPDPAEDLPEELRGLYRDLKRWRNDRARADGVPAYTIARNTQLAEICRKQPRSLAALREIEGFGEATCGKYGKELIALMPAAREDARPPGPAQPPVEPEAKP
jgi:ATP-dependent DNA helicase RecQ